MFEQTKDLGLGTRLAMEDTFLGLGDDLPHARDHLLELGFQDLERSLPRGARRALAPIKDFPGKALCLSNHAARGTEKIGIDFVQLLLAL
jgi:hypothetical protein